MRLSLSMSDIIFLSNFPFSAFPIGLSSLHPLQHPCDRHCMIPLLPTELPLPACHSNVLILNTSYSSNFDFFIYQKSGQKLIRVSPYPEAHGIPSTVEAPESISLRKSTFLIQSDAWKQSFPLTAEEIFFFFFFSPQSIQVFSFRIQLPASPSHGPPHRPLPLI